MNQAPIGWAITPASLLNFFAAFAWVGLLIVAIAGFGGALCASFRMRHPPLALVAVAGFGPFLLLGGVLNLVHLISAPALLALTIFGLVLFCLTGLRSRPTADTSQEKPTAPGAAGSLWTRAGFLLVMLVFTLRLASTAQTAVYLDSDDLEYYLAVPVKMLELHSLTPEPYSERRVMSSVGGNYFLEAAVLAERPLENMQMADWTLGCVLLALAGFAVAGELELTPLQASVFAFLLLITPQTRLNLTFVILPSALFLGLVYLAVQRRLTAQHPWLQAAAIGGTVAAIASMKSTFVTHGVVFVLCLAVLRWRTRGLVAGLRLLLVAGCCCFLVLLPWMLANGADVGTWFYPLLGKGTHYSAYGLYPPPTNLSRHVLLFKVLPFCLPLLLIGAVEYLFGEREERTWTIATYTFAALIATFLVGAATGGDSVRRYNYPCMLPAITLAWVVFARRFNVARALRSSKLWRWQAAAVAAAALAAAVAIDNGLSSFTFEYRHTWEQLRTSLSTYQIVPESRRQEYAAMERAIPAGATTIVTLDFPFLLDYATKPLLIADFPGAASPRPGWPGHADADTLASFLLSHGVRYLAYSYAECKLDPKFTTCSTQKDAEQAATLAGTQASQWIKSETMISRDARHQYEALGKTRRHLYDDGHIFVLDLQPEAGVAHGS